MNMFDIIVNDNMGREDRHLLHKLLEGQHFIIQNQTKIMNQLDALKTAIANEDIEIVDLVQAYIDLVAKLNSLPADDSDALATLTADANAQSAAILGALHPVTATPAPAASTDAPAQ